MKFLLVVAVTALISFSCENSDTDFFNSPESSWIEGATYNGQTDVLTIETDKQEYTFVDVPQEVWNEFKNASSKGTYYHENIKGKYHY